MSEMLVMQWRSLMLDSAVKAIVLFLAAGTGALGLRRASAAARHLVWQLALGSFLVLPLLSLLLPSWQMHVSSRALPASWSLRPEPGARTLLPQPGGDSAHRNFRVSTGSRETAGVQSSLLLRETRAATSLGPNGVSLLLRQPQVEWSNGQAVPPPLVSPPVRPSKSETPLVSLTGHVGTFLLWLVGVAALLARALGGLFQLRRIQRRCRRVTAAPVVTLASELARDMGLHRPVHLLHGLLDGPPALPMTWGFRDPVVLVPTGFAAWPEARQRAVLLHELAHVRRGDWLIQWVASLTCAFYWFHPLVWWSARRLRIESEQACDDRVLTAGMKASDYASHLLGVVRASNQSRRMLRAAVSMARGPLLERRLRAILDGRRRRGGLPRRATSLSLVAAAGLVLPLATARVTAMSSRVSSSRSSMTGPAPRSLRRAAVGPLAQVCRITEASERRGPEHTIRTPAPKAPATARTARSRPAPLPSGHPLPSQAATRAPSPRPSPLPGPRLSSGSAQGEPAGSGPLEGGGMALAQRKLVAMARAGRLATLNDGVESVSAAGGGEIVLAAERDDSDGPPSVEPNLADKDLSGANLAGRDLSGKDLSGKDLSGANLSGAKLANANLSHTDLSGANLSSADLAHAKMTGTDLSGANLKGAHLIGIDLSGVDCSGANLEGVEAADLTFKHSDLSGANLKGIRLDGRDLSSSDFSGADLSGARLAGANLTKADLSGANLSDADLSHARLVNADLSGANLNGTKLDGADLKGTDVSGTKLDRPESD